MKTRQPRHHSTQRRRLFLPLFIVFLMVGSVFGVLIYGFSQDDSVGSGDLLQTGTGRWQFTRDGQTVELQYGPSTIIRSDVSVGPLQTAQKVYVSTGDEDYFNAVPDLYGALQYRTFVVLSCYEDADGCENLPLKTCEDAGDGVVVVELRNAEEGLVTYNDGCYVVEGDGIFITQAVDGLILDYFEVDV